MPGDFLAQFPVSSLYYDLRKVFLAALLLGASKADVGLWPIPMRAREKPTLVPKVTNIHCTCTCTKTRNIRSFERTEKSKLYPSKVSTVAYLKGRLWGMCNFKQTLNESSNRVLSRRPYVELAAYESVHSENFNCTLYYFIESGLFCLWFLYRNVLWVI